MALENLLGYVVVLGLPLWLVAEELLNRFGSGVRREQTAAARAEAPASEPAGLERRARRAPVHASSV